MERSWSSKTKGEVRAGILSIGGDWTEEIAERVVTKMDHFTRGWVMMQEGICKDALVRKTMPKEAYTKVSLCLRSSLIAQQTLAAVLKDPTRDAVLKADKSIERISQEAKDCPEKATYISYDEQEDDKAASEAREKLAQSTVYQELKDKRAGESAQAAEDAAKRSKSERVKLDVLLRRAWRKWARAEHAAAIADASRALGQAKKAGYERGQADALSITGLVYDSKGEYEKALAYFQKALVIHKRLFGPEHQSTASSYSNIGSAYYMKSEYDKALEFHEKALSIRERVFGPDHPATAASYNNIGSVYSSKGEHDKGLGFHKKALDISERVLGTNHPSTARHFSSIGFYFYKSGKYDKALEYQEKALSIEERVWGTKHPSTATTYASMAILYAAKGQYDEAFEYYQKAIAIYERVFGPDDRRSINARSDVIELCKKGHKPACGRR